MGYEIPLDHHGPTPQDRAKTGKPPRTGLEPQDVREVVSKLSSKDSNPKDAVGGTKARWMSYIPLRVLYGVGLAMYEGCRKYGRHNYRIAGIRASVYADAAAGHIQDWMEGQDIDPDSGLSHIDKAIASLFVLRDGMLGGNWTDDRPPSIANIDAFKTDLNAKWQAITAKYPDAKPAYTIADTIEGK